MSDHVESSAGVVRRGGAYAVVRWGLGLLLLVAAALKTHQLATQPTTDLSLLTSRLFLVFWVQVEIILGLWLCSGLVLRLGYVAAVACFTLFSIVTFWKAVHGETSCGCFGVVEVNPWYTLILDLLALATAIVFHPNLPPAAPPVHAKLRLAASISLALTAGVTSCLSAALYQPASLSAEGQIIGNDRFVVLEPRPGWGNGSRSSDTWTWPTVLPQDAGRWCSITTIVLTARRRCPSTSARPARRAFGAVSPQWP